MFELCMSGKAWRIFLLSSLAQTIKAFMGRLMCGSLLPRPRASLKIRESDTLGLPGEGKQGVTVSVGIHILRSTVHINWDRNVRLDVILSTENHEKWNGERLKASCHQSKYGPWSLHVNLNVSLKFFKYYDTHLRKTDYQRKKKTSRNRKNVKKLRTGSWFSSTGYGVSMQVTVRRWSDWRSIF